MPQHFLEAYQWRLILLALAPTLVARVVYSYVIVNHAVLRQKGPESRAGLRRFLRGIFHLDKVMVHVCPIWLYFMILPGPHPVNAAWAILVHHLSSLYRLPIALVMVAFAYSTTYVFFRLMGTDNVLYGRHLGTQPDAKIPSTYTRIVAFPFTLTDHPMYLASLVQTTAWYVLTVGHEHIQRGMLVMLAQQLGQYLFMIWIETRYLDETETPGLPANRPERVMG